MKRVPFPESLRNGSEFYTVRKDQAASRMDFAVPTLHPRANLSSITRPVNMSRPALIEQIRPAQGPEFLQALFKTADDVLDGLSFEQSLSDLIRSHDFVEVIFLELKLVRI